MTCCRYGAWMKWKIGLARCRALEALPSIMRRKTPRCATMKPDLRSPILSQPCAKAGMSHQANPHLRRKRGRSPRQRQRPLPPQATEKRTKQRRTRRRHHPKPLHRNLPRTLLLRPPSPRPSCPKQNPQRLGAIPQQNQQPKPRNHTNHKHPMRSLRVTNKERSSKL